MSKPRYLEGMAEVSSGPQFSTCAGLISHALESPLKFEGRTYRPKARPETRIGRISQWLRENL